MTAEKKAAWRWTVSIFIPLLLAVWNAWDHNFDAVCGWLSCFVWVVVAGVKELRDYLESDDEGGIA